ncbi:hypothetical protein BpHYR1_047649 [Brachionus plicatilis]|uniref:Uncharacterized protein n=1 Tax=Brachionus plicatilis TaxID=10195 RepID=A0A3M7RXL8_BRAPC|nr:hypothetical protein BpHYR1_047649 [Brachionus plicatilis]
MHYSNQQVTRAFHLKLDGGYFFCPESNHLRDQIKSRIDSLFQTAHESEVSALSGIWPARNGFLFMVAQNRVFIFI